MQLQILNRLPPEDSQVSDVAEAVVKTTNLQCGRKISLRHPQPDATLPCAFPDRTWVWRCHSIDCCWHCQWIQNAWSKDFPRQWTKTSRLSLRTVAFERKGISPRARKPLSRVDTDLTISWVSQRKLPWSQNRAGLPHRACIVTSCLQAHFSKWTLGWLRCLNPVCSFFFFFLNDVCPQNHKS